MNQKAEEKIYTKKKVIGLVIVSVALIIAASILFYFYGNSAVSKENPIKDVTDFGNDSLLMKWCFNNDTRFVGCRSMCVNHDKDIADIYECTMRFYTIISETENNTLVAPTHMAIFMYYSARDQIISDEWYLLAPYNPEDGYMIYQNNFTGNPNYLNDK